MSKRSMFFFIFSLCSLSGCFLDEVKETPKHNTPPSTPEAQPSIENDAPKQQVIKKSPQTSVKPIETPHQDKKNTVQEPAEVPKEPSGKASVAKPPQNAANEHEESVAETETTLGSSPGSNPQQTQSKTATDSVESATKTVDSHSNSISNPVNQAATPELTEADQDSNENPSANSSDVSSEQPSADKEPNTAPSTETNATDTPPTEPPQLIFNANTPYRHYPIDCKNYGAYRCFMMEAPLDHHAENPGNHRIYLKFRLYKNDKAEATALISSLNADKAQNWVLNKSTPQAALGAWTMLEVQPRAKAKDGFELKAHIKQHAQDVAHVYQQLLQKNLITPDQPLIWLGQDLGTYAGLDFQSSNKLDKMVLDFSVNNNSAANAIEAQAPQVPALLINAPIAWQQQTNDQHTFLQLANTQYHKTLWLYRIENIWLDEKTETAQRDDVFDLMGLIHDYVNAGSGNHTEHHPLNPDSKASWQFKKVSDSARNKARYTANASDTNFKPDLYAQFMDAKKILPRVVRSQD